MYTLVGATGNIGKKVTDLLLLKGLQVRLIARSTDAMQPAVVRGAEAMPGDARDPEFLTRAFAGAEAVFTMIPPNVTAKDFLAYAGEISDSMVTAVRRSGVTHVVNLSSIGADLTEGTGPIAGLHRLEGRLNAVPGLNVLHLRAAYFMENLLMNIDLIRSKGIAGGAIRGNVAIPMIATKDIAAAAADRLVRRDFTGSTVQHLLGPRDLTLSEAVAVVGDRIGKPGLAYTVFSYVEAEKGLIAAGLSPDMSRLYVEMSRAFNEGRITATVTRSPESTTPTTIEEFAEVFAGVYGTKKAA